MPGSPGNHFVWTGAAGDWNNTSIWTGAPDHYPGDGAGSGGGVCDTVDFPFSGPPVGGTFITANVSVTVNLINNSTTGGASAFGVIFIRSGITLTVGRVSGSAGSPGPRLINFSNAYPNFVFEDNTSKLVITGMSTHWTNTGASDLYLDNTGVYGTGTCDTNGTDVQWVSGSSFTNLSRTIIINNVSYWISSVNSPTDITLTTSAGVQSGVVFSAIGLVGEVDIIGNSTHYNPTVYLHGQINTLKAGGTPSSGSPIIHGIASTLDEFTFITLDFSAVTSAGVTLQNLYIALPQNTSITATMPATPSWVSVATCPIYGANASITAMGATDNGGNTQWVFAAISYTLTYTAGLHGSITGVSPQTVVSGGSGTQVTAVPDAHYHFTSWSDSVLTASRTDTNVTGNITVTASFAIDTYTLTYTAGSHGSIVGTSPQTVNYGGSGSSVTASADPSYNFSSWSDTSTQNPRTDTNVTGNISVTASFVPAGGDAVIPRGIRRGMERRMFR